MGGIVVVGEGNARLKASDKYEGMSVFILAYSIHIY